MSEEGLKRAEEREDAKGKGEKERYTQLNAEFLGIARRDMKAFFNEQYKEIEENNRMGKIRDLLKKEIKGIFYARLGLKNNRLYKDLTKPEGIKSKVRIHKRIIQKCLNDPDNHDGVVIYLEPNVWECELNVSLGNFIMDKASGDDGNPVELFQILKHNAVKML